MKKLVIATRRSRLALWQAQHIAGRLQAAHAGLAVELLPMSTRGDELIDRRLDQAGGKGLFVKELENALRGAARGVTSYWKVCSCARKALAESLRERQGD